MPDINQIEGKLFGTRISPVLDLEEAIAYLNTIRSGRVYWHANYPPYSHLEVEYSVNGGDSYTKLPYKGKGMGYSVLKGMNNDMQLRLKIHLRSHVTDILPSDCLEVYKIEVVLSDKPETEWDYGKKATLSWDKEWV